ncbi:MAG TPA: YetF domain-containing protein [Methylomirabilota bacterium]|nr:YetF domain-containing protein [Methylomirabilota bacterium]
MWILSPEIAVAEKLLRSAVVYLFLLIAFRLMGKRQLGQMTAFDLVVLLIISNVVQNALIGNDNSLGGGLIGATAILLLNAGVAWLTFRYKRLERLVEHSPTVIVRHGRILRENLRQERLSLSELRSALRQQGVMSLRDVRYVILEEDGKLSVITRLPATP